MVNKCEETVLDKKVLIIICFLFAALNLPAENGHNLWLRGKSTGPVKIICSKSSATLDIAKQELKNSWQGKSGATIALKVESNPLIKGDGFKLSPGEIQANTDLGILYGVYELLRRQQTGQSIIINEISNPSYERRILDHWDNLNGTIERGYAGLSIFWHSKKDSFTVTEKDKNLWKEYARANASIGINGAVLNNVNASPKMLSGECLKKVKAIADVLRPFGIRTYLSVNFASPAVLGRLKTSDPLDVEVINWWKNKVKEIYSLIPDFGGFLVKANSEGQTGSNAVSQYHKPLRSHFNDVKTCPEIYLLWFHHLPWNYKMKSGLTLWDEMCYHYEKGLQQVRQFQKILDKVQPYVDPERFSLVQKKLRKQCINAQEWKDGCLLYFQQFSRLPIPYDIERPVYNLKDLEKMNFSKNNN